MAAVMTRWPQTREMEGCVTSKGLGNAALLVEVSGVQMPVRGPDGAHRRVDGPGVPDPRRVPDPGRPPVPRVLAGRRPAGDERRAGAVHDEHGSRGGLLGALRPRRPPGAGLGADDYEPLFELD